MTEAAILSEVLVAVTALPETVAWRSNSGTFLTLDGARYVRANVRGIGDVTGCRRGRAFVIETKTLRGAQRKTQENFQRRWEAAGGAYIIARSGPAAAQAVEAL